MTLEKLGADIEIEGGYVIARAPKGLRGHSNKKNILTTGRSPMQYRNTTTR